MKERIVDEQIRLVPYYRNDAVSLRWYQDAAVCKQVDNRDIFAIWGKFFTAPSSYHHDVTM